MRYRLIAVDIDGTLLNPARELEEETVRAAKKAMEAGAYFVLSSGRMPQALKSIAERLGVNAPAVCFNGGAVVDVMTGKTLFSTPVDLSLAREIAVFGEEKGLYMHAFIHGSYIAPRFTDMTQDYQTMVGVKANVINGNISEYLDEAPMKLLVLDKPEECARILPVLQEKFGDRANIMPSQKHIIECVGKQTSKARALEFVRQMLDIPYEETCAFGDGMNDLEMLLWSAHPYVMDNASDALKKASDRFVIAPSNADFGVARVLMKEACGIDL